MIATTELAPVYTGHAAARRAGLAARCHRPPARRSRQPVPGDHGGWTLAGLVIGAAVLAALCVVALSAHAKGATGGSLLSAVPTDAAFEAAVVHATDLLAPYEPATRASDIADPEAWGDEFLAAAVAPALAELVSVTPPSHLGEAVDDVQRALRRVRAELEGLRACAATGRECRTQRHAFHEAVDDVFRRVGDLDLYTFG